MSGDSSMLLLEQTTLFYHDLAFRAFDDSTTGLVDNWVAQIPPKNFKKFKRKASLHSDSTGNIQSSTAVSSEKSKRQVPVPLFAFTANNPVGVNVAVKKEAKQFRVVDDTSSDAEWVYDDEVNATNSVCICVKL
jgi:hypothetical protein